MNQILVISSACLISLALWGLRKKPLRLPLTSKQKIAGRNWNSHELVILEQRKPSPDSCNSEIQWNPPSNPLDRIQLKKQLFKGIAGGPEERLQAMNLAGLWGHKSILPILRRGLKDGDIRVVHAAAKAIARHKTITYQSKAQATLRPPRNVALTR